MSELLPEVEVILAEYSGAGKNPALRLYIDHPEGVDHGLCRRVTDSLRDLLQEFSLEVSSPGVERPLTKPEHFQRFSGRRVNVTLREPIGERRNFKGKLTEVDAETIELSCEPDAVKIPFEAIQSSNLLADQGGVASV